MARSLADGPAMHRLDPVGGALLFKVHVGSCESESSQLAQYSVSSTHMSENISSFRLFLVHRSVRALFAVPLLFSPFACLFRVLPSLFLSLLLLALVVRFSTAGSRRWGNATNLVGFFRRVGPRAESIFNK